MERPKGFMLLTEDAKTHEDMPTENHRHKCDDPLERLKGFSWLALETIPHGDIHPESLGANARTHWKDQRDLGCWQYMQLLMKSCATKKNLGANARAHWKDQRDLGC